MPPNQSVASEPSADSKDTDVDPPCQPEEPLDDHQDVLHFCPYDGVTAVISSALEHDETADVSTMFLGPVDVLNRLASCLSIHSLSILKVAHTEYYLMETSLKSW